jgi:hypothetical protein
VATARASIVVHHDNVVVGVARSMLAWDRHRMFIVALATVA